jgi:hypothetical protein
MSNIPEHFLKKIQETKKKQLKELDLSFDWDAPDDQKLTHIPAEVFELEQLEVLILRNNRLSAIPDAIARLRNLTELSLSGNQLSTVSDSIGKLGNLTLLNLNSNRLTDVPDAIVKLRNLTYMDLSDNQLTAVPDAITQLHNLEWLDLSDNLVTAIKNYFDQIKDKGEVVYLYEAKLLIIGERGAGKTTLARKIKNFDYQLRTDDTSDEGLQENDRLHRVNIWDFGKQEIYHGTHQFFLSKRSFYTLVDDTCKEDTDCFYYWLNSVELLSDNSPGDYPK